LIFKEVNPYLDSTNSEIEKESYIKMLAETLEVSEKQIQEDYKKGKSGVVRKKNKSDDKEIILTPSQLSQELNLMVILANNRSIFSKVKGKLKISLLTDNYAIDLYTTLEDAERQGITSNEAFSQLIENDELRKLIKRSFTMKVFKNNKNLYNDINYSILRIQLLDVERKRRNIINLLKYSVEENGEAVQNLSELLTQKKDLDDKYETLKTDAEATLLEKVENEDN